MRCGSFKSGSWIGAIVATLFAGVCAHADVISNFNTDQDGWTLFQNTGSVDWIAAGGNPGGHIGATDNTAQWAYVEAPSKFLAPATYNGTFSFDLKVETLATPLPPNTARFNVRVGLQGAGITLINEGPLPTLNWTNYSFALNESSAAGWRTFTDLNQNYSAGAPQATQAQMQAVLAGLTRIVIATDYTLAATSNGNDPRGVIDRTYIDNVRLTTQSVPEPTSLALLGMGLGSLGIARFRRRSANG